MDQVRPSEVSLPARSEVGFLSRTVSSSSTTKWILPARLRSTARNDIVFVGDNSIQLREFVTTSEAHLVDVTTKFAFRSLILAAGVISAPTEVEKVDVLEQIVNQTVEKEHYVIGGKPLPDDYPAQILVLALAACELAFVYVQQEPSGACTFRWARRPILAGCDLPDKFCKTLAIDPGSRALAFAPSMGYVGIASLNRFECIKSAIDGWQPSRPQSFLPWIEQHFIQVDGHVIKMDFLKSADEDPGNVILLLLVVNAGTTSLLLYCWETRMPLHRIKSMGCSGQILAPEDCLPLMLIPCGGMASFFLVTENELVLYGQVTASKVHRTPYPLPTETTKERNRRPRPLLWSQWAKPSRYQDYKKTNEDIMLVREDGLLQYFMIQHKPKTRARSSTAAGHLKFDVNTAVCMIPVPRDIGGGDILIVGGSMCTGGVFHLPPREAPVLIQSLPNWAPFNDLLLLKSTTLSSSLQSERRLIVCSGNKDGQGSIAEIHHGLEAQVGWRMEHSDSASIERIWTIEDEMRGTLLILFSHSLHTSLVLYNLDSTEFEYADAETYPGLDLNSPTLSAARLGDDVFVQITSTSITIFSFSDHFEPVKRNFRSPGLLCAEIVVSLGTVICAYPTLYGYTFGTIDLRKNTLDDNIFTTALELDSQPISIHPAIFGGSHLVFVGSKQGNLTAYAMGEDLNLTSLLELDLSKIVDTAEDIRVSSMCFLAYPSNPIGLLLCGLRSGYLVSIELRARKESLSVTHLGVKDRQVHRLGSTTIILSPDGSPTETSAPTAAFAICQSLVRRISLKNNAAGADTSITPVFFVERGVPSKASPTINASCRVQQLHSDPLNDISNLLISATPKTILFSSLVPQPCGVVQTNPVQGTPKHAIYSAFLNQLVVGTDYPSGPLITFMEASTGEGTSDQAMYKISQTIKVGDSNERIGPIIAYRPTDGSRHFEFLVIALNATGTDSRSQAQTITGRVVCLSLPRIKKGSSSATSSKPHLILRTPDKAITAISVSGESDLLVGTEKQLKLFTFDFEARQWTEASTFDLPSAIAAIDVNLGGCKILVATKKHSWMVFKQSQEGDLVLLESDRQARNLMSIQSFLGKRALVTSLSERGTTLMCMREDVEQGGQMRVVCDATVPLFLERVVEETEGLATIMQGRQRSSFIGCSADGTVYRFLMLRKEEWDLLSVVQCLDEENKGSSSSKGKSKAAAALKLRQATTARTDKTAYSHIDGDALADLVGEGVMSLRNLLGEKKVKTEVEQEEEANDDEGVAKRGEEMARKLAELKKVALPLVGDDSDDVVGAVIIWLRQILNWVPV
ncbi:hypothetical protein DV736_g3444, partial [Chaetothyriales sp. CBS 134916]